MTPEGLARVLVSLMGKAFRVLDSGTIEAMTGYRGTLNSR